VEFATSLEKIQDLQRGGHHDAVMLKNFEGCRMRDPYNAVEAGDDGPV
jgi:hypothetical protein